MTATEWFDTEDAARAACPGTPGLDCVLVHDGRHVPFRRYRWVAV